MPVTVTVAMGQAGTSSGCWAHGAPADVVATRGAGLRLRGRSRRAAGSRRGRWPGRRPGHPRRSHPACSACPAGPARWAGDPAGRAGDPARRADRARPSGPPDTPPVGPHLPTTHPVVTETAEARGGPRRPARPKAKQKKKSKKKKSKKRLTDGQLGTFVLHSFVKPPVTAGRYQLHGTQPMDGITVGRGDVIVSSCATRCRRTRSSRPSPAMAEGDFGTRLPDRPEAADPAVEAHQAVPLGATTRAPGSPWW